MQRVFSDLNGKHAACHRYAVAVGVCFALLFFAPSSQAFVVYDGVDDSFSRDSTVNQAGNPPVADDPFSMKADQCLSLLRTIRYSSSDSALHRNKNQHFAGKAAALGLVFGVRFALSPPHNHKVETRHKARLDLWTQKGRLLTENRPALAVSAYRQCRKEKALQALNGFRWAR